MFIDIFSEKPLVEEVEEKLIPSRPYTDEDKDKVFSLYLQGYKTSQISKTLGIPQGTVRKWIDAFSEAVRTDLEDRTGADMLSTILEEYEFLKNFAYNQIQNLTTEVADDGTILHKAPNHQALAKYLDLVGKVLKDKTDLLCKAGAIAKEPDKLQTNIRGENKSEARITVEATERSVEEIQRDIEHRLKHANTI